MSDPEFDSPGARVRRFLVLVLLSLSVLGFGLASLCGGVFTVASLGNKNDLGVWMLSLPSLLLGGALCWLSGRALRKAWRRDAG